MMNFTFQLPTQICFGKDQEKLAGPLISVTGRHVLLVYGSERVFWTEEGNNLLRSLQVFAMKQTRLANVRSENQLEKIRQGIALCREQEVDCLLAIGGGTVMDTAKAIALGATSETDILDMARSGKTPDLALPLGAVLTVPATSSESSSVLTLEDEKTGEMHTLSSPSLRPVFAIMNPAMTTTLSRLQTTSSGFDAFSYAFARFFDLGRDSALLDEMTAAVMRSMIQQLPRVIEDPENLAARADLMWAAAIVNNDMLGPGGEYSCHRIARTLSVTYGLNKAAALAMTLPVWWRVLMEEAPERFADFAEMVFGVERDDDAYGTALQGQEKLKAFAARVGFSLVIRPERGQEGSPTRLAEMTLGKEETLGKGPLAMDRRLLAKVFGLILG